MASLERFIQNVVEQLIQPVIALLFALAMFMFVNGLVMYVLKSDDPKERAKGSQHMLWSVIGLVIMSSVLLLLQLLVNTFGIDTPPGTLDQ